MELAKKRSVVGSESRISHKCTPLTCIKVFFHTTRGVSLPIEKEALRTGSDVTLSTLNRHHSNVEEVSLQFPVSRWGIPAAQRYVL